MATQGLRNSGDIDFPLSISLAGLLKALAVQGFPLFCHTGGAAHGYRWCVLGVFFHGLDAILKGRELHNQNDTFLKGRLIFFHKGFVLKGKNLLLCKFFPLRTAFLENGKCRSDLMMMYQCTLTHRRCYIVKLSVGHIGFI